MNDIQMNIIEQYGRNPRADFTINQIAKATGGTYSHVYKNIKELVEEGILNRVKKGNTSLCTLNLENDRTRLMLAIGSQDTKNEFSKSKKLISKLVSELIEPLKSKTDLRLVALFGSYAKGTERKDSDIDLVVISDKEEVVHREINTLEMKYGKSISPVIVTEEMFIKMLKEDRQNVAREVLSDGIIFFGFEKYWMMVSESI